MSLPPTTSKISGDANDLTTFKFRFPNFTGTHSGITVTLDTLSIAGGGTGQTTKAAGFDALSPMTTSGDIIYGGTSGTGTRLPKGTDGQFLKLVSGLPAWGAAPSAPRSEVWLLTDNGYGSTNNKIRRFTTTQKNTGTAITYADSATNGATFTINEDGVYAITYTDNGTTAMAMGVSVNSTQLTTSISSITAADRRVRTTTPTSNQATVCAVTLNLSIGDVVRAHTDGTATGTDTSGDGFRIVKVSD